jgi:hypothetical protein
VRRKVARDVDIAAKYTHLALARLGRESVPFADDVEVMTNEKMTDIAGEIMRLQEEEERKERRTKGK